MNNNERTYDAEGIETTWDALREMVLQPPTSGVGAGGSAGDPVADSGDDALTPTTECKNCGERQDAHRLVWWDDRDGRPELVCTGQYEDIDQFEVDNDGEAVRYDHCAHCGMSWFPEGRIIPSGKCPECGSGDVIEPERFH